jgi:hypothetical protein
MRLKKFMVLLSLGLIALVLFASWKPVTNTQVQDTEAVNCQFTKVNFTVPKAG